ncbi:MAG: glycosyltransferase family 1 protein [Pirellulales bacterium]
MNHSRIIYDRRWIGKHGIGRYAAELAKRLPFVELPELTGKPASISDPFTMRSQLRRHKAECYLTPGFNAVWRPPCPVLLTVHDLIPIACREAKSSAKTAYFYALQRPLIRKSPVTFTVSEFSKQEIMRYAGVNADRICVTGNGISDDFSPTGKSFIHARPYILYVGNPKPHKNVALLFEALSEIVKREDIDLIAVCSRSDELVRRSVQLGIDNRIHWRSGLSDAELAELYRGAKCLVMPSLYEGFGLPIVEAMACGCPVVCSDRTSLPEVAGDAGFTFDPGRKEGLVDVVLTLLQDRTPLAAMREAGLRRAALYRWDTVAERVIEALRRHSFLA